MAETDARTLPRAGVVDTLAVAGTIVLPLLARGLIIRRPPVVRLAERLDADRKGVRLLQRLRRQYGRGPLRLRIPGRRMVLLLDPQHVHRVLAESPDPFSPATREKRSALAHFQPHGLLISPNELRPQRRAFNEDVLDSPHAVHRGADPIVRTIGEEVDALLARTAGSGELLTWDAYNRMWQRLVRRIVLGDGAADDDAFGLDLVRLRATANWAFLHPKRRALRERFLRRIQEHLDRADPGSLAAWVARAPAPPGTDPVQQVPQWLFAYDAASWASYRALGLLASHPDHLATAQAEVAGVDLDRPADLPYLRACLLESLRLWPTTPAVLRETTRRTRWEGGPMPEGTSLLTYAPFFHRDDENVDAADRFEPELWATRRTEQDWPLIPFSAGPAECAGRNLVLHTASTALARLVSGRRLDLQDPDRLRPDRPLPSVLDPFSLRFAVTPSERTAA